MKTWRDLKSIAIPHDLESRPRDARGYPIPVAVVIDANGKPDFRVTDQTMWVRLLRERRCHMCGGPLQRSLTFVGGPASMRSRCFTDGPMHDECAQYALQVCPFLAAPSFAYARASPKVEGREIVVNEAMSTERPAYFGHGYTTAYRVGVHPTAGLLIQADSWFGVDWWKDGVRLEEEPT